jgi:hypothetical protein
MQMGRFFSIGKGQVGQYLSPRVLVVRTPFQNAVKHKENCYFGFEKLSQAQKFAQILARSGRSFQLRSGQVLTQFPYEIKLSGDSGTARVLAYWDRLDQKQFSAIDKTRSPRKRDVQNDHPIALIAA